MTLRAIMFILGALLLVIFGGIIIGTIMSFVIATFGWFLGSAIISMTAIVMILLALYAGD